MLTSSCLTEQHNGLRARGYLELKPPCVICCILLQLRQPFTCCTGRYRRKRKVSALCPSEQSVKGRDRRKRAKARRTGLGSRHGQGSRSCGITAIEPAYRHFGASTIARGRAAIHSAPGQGTTVTIEINSDSET